MVKMFLWPIFIVVIVTTTAYPQSSSDTNDQDHNHISADRIGSFYSILPIAGYNSDWGVYGGGFFQRINYDVGVEPFLSNLKMDFTISTRGYFISKLEYERTKIFGFDLRNRFEFIGQRITRGHYFGIGNNTTFSESKFDEGYYFYENRELYLKYNLRKKVGNFSESGNIDLFGTTTFWRVNGLPRGEESRFLEDEPPGFELNTIGKIGIGVIFDSRNDEFFTTTGIQYEAGFSVAPSIFGFDYSYTELAVDLRQYVTIIPDVVFAHRIKYDQTFGDVPFWAMPALGNEYGLRGFYLNRFRGERSILSMTEIRTWLFSLWDDQIKVGSQIFWDTGRVYSEYDSNAFFADWKHSFGLGLAFTLFHPDFILRSDFGFSNEAFRFYFGTGYTF